nr:MAG TPA: hypothetical protein [Caudoviricetes sp.]
MKKSGYKLVIPMACRLLKGLKIKQRKNYNLNR